VAQLFSSWPIWGLIGTVLVIFLADWRFPHIVDKIEETILALLLVTITLVSFSQVVMRYGFSSGWTGALEFTRIAFAWMILFGMSYALKINAHLGVDAFIRALPPRAFKAVALFGALACVAYGVILLASDWLQLLGANARGGAVDYWSKMFKIGIGLDELAYPQWIVDAFGLSRDRVHRWLAYLMLPIGLGLFVFRSIQAFIAIWKGDRELVIAGHEAEDLVAENKNALQE
jgi:C4-dicarboxylate transporter DctQ subunit